MAGTFPLWAQLLTGLVMVAILFFLGPPTMRALKHGPKGSAHDWIGLAKPVAIVVGIIAVLIFLTQV